MTEDEAKELSKGIAEALKNFKVPPLTEREKIELERCRLAEREAKIIDFMVGDCGLKK